MKKKTKSRLKGAFLFWFPLILSFGLLFPINQKLMTSIFTGTLDELSFVWIFHRLSENLLLHWDHLFDGGIFYPELGNLLFSEMAVGMSLVYRLFFILGQNKILAYNLAILSCFVLNYTAMYFFCRLFVSRISASAGAVVFSFSMIRLAHLQHAHLLPQFGFPLVGYCLFRWEQTRSPKFLWSAVVSVALQFYLSVSLGLILFISLFPYVVIQLSKPSWKSMLGPGALLGVLLLPLGLAYYRVVHTYHFVRSLEEVVSASIRSYFIVPPTQVYEPFLVGFLLRGGPGSRQEKNLFIGFVVIFLVFWGWKYLKEQGRKTQLARQLIAWSLCFVILMSLGRNAGLYNLFYYILPGMKGMRTPARFGLSYLFILSTIAALGFERLPKRYFAGLAGSLFFCFLIENHLKIPLIELPRRLEGVTAFLKTRPQAEPVLFLPFSDPHRDALRMFHQLEHGHPIANGYAGFHAPSYVEFESLSSGCRIPLRKLRDKGIRYVVVEKNAISQSARGCLENVGTPHYEDSEAAVFTLYNRQ